MTNIVGKAKYLWIRASEMAVVHVPGCKHKQTEEEIRPRGSDILSSFTWSMRRPS